MIKTGTHVYRITCSDAVLWKGEREGCWATVEFAQLEEVVGSPDTSKQVKNSATETL